MSLIKQFSEHYSKNKQEIMSLDDYLNLCKKDKMAYATAAERMLAAIGKPEIVDTSNDPRLSRIFSNRTIMVYPAFKDFYGMEEAIERIVGFFKHSAQGLEEKKQILYLLGPVGAAKSSIAEKLKELMEVYPIYVLGIRKSDGTVETSPIFESPLSIFKPSEFGQLFEDEYNIPKRYLTGLPSPWFLKRLEENNGNLDNFVVIRMMPSKLNQVAIVKTEPGDDNNQDISALVGKVDIRKLEYYSQNDVDAYTFSGALNRANQGLMEFVEMFKANIKLLHPLLTATQEGNYMGTENIPAIPFNGLIVSHSNESEWQQFRNNKTNEAFLDRVCVIKVPYCLRYQEEEKIYKKMLSNSSLAKAPCAPKTLELLSMFSVLTRLEKHENSSQFSKMRVYNGDNIKDIDPRSKNIMEYREKAGHDEGMKGFSTRSAFKILSNTFNFDKSEISADPIHLFMVLEEHIKREQLPDEVESEWLEYIKGVLMPKYLLELEKHIHASFVENFDSYGQNIFENYFTYADHWKRNEDYKDPDTGQIFDREHLNNHLEKIEKPAGIGNPKDFRSEIVEYVLRYQARHSGNKPNWKDYNQIREVIERNICSNMGDLLPIISYGAKKDSESQEKYSNFISRMIELGYGSEKVVNRAVEFFKRAKKN